MTFLSSIQTLMGKKAQPIPSAIFASTETHIIQVKSLALDAVARLGTFPWQETEARVTATAISGTDQGTLDSLFQAGLTAGVFSLCSGSLWHVTTNFPMYGPLSAVEWQRIVTFPSGGPEFSYRIMGNHLHVWPALTAGAVLAAILRTNWIVRSSASVPQQTLQADDDIFTIPEVVFQREVEWRWLKEKGEPWTACYEEAQALIATHLSSKGAGEVLHMDTVERRPRPGVWVPAGGWVTS